MQAENQRRQEAGLAQAFLNVIQEEGTDWNAIHRILYQ